MSEPEEKVQFKPIRRKNIRQRKASSDEDTTKPDDDTEIHVKLEVINETKEKQKLRNRSHGVNMFVAQSLNRKGFHEF